MAIEIKVKDDMTESVATVTPKDSAERVLKKIVTLDIGAIVVVEEKEPVGIITSTDLLKRVFNKKKDPKQVKAEEVMTEPVKTISPDTDIEKATKLMRDLNVKRLPVVENGKLAGIISETDVITIDPALHEIIAEAAETKRFTPPSEKKFTGVCEECNTYSENLINKEGRLVCPDCR